MVGLCCANPPELSQKQDRSAAVITAGLRLDFPDRQASVLKCVVPALRKMDREGDRQHAIEVPLTEASNNDGIVLANLPAGPTERRIAVAVGLAILSIAGLAVPFASMQLPQNAAWIPITSTYIFAADLVTSVLLVSQFDIVRRPALLALASGYLFTALMAVPILLTFPGTFTETGLLGAGRQTNGWLSAFWVSGYPIAATGYAMLKDREPGVHVSHGPLPTGVAASFAVSVVIVLALTWIATAGEPHLPRIFADETRAAINIRYVGAFLLLLNAIALLLLWLKRRSVIGLWLMVVMCGSTANALVGWILTPGRFSLAFYAGRSFLVIIATVMLIVLLTETMTLYARLAVSILAQRREREHRMMTMEALAASIAHELRQPLAAMAAHRGGGQRWPPRPPHGSGGLRWLDRPVPDIPEVRAALQRILRDSHRAADTIESIRSLFRVADQERSRLFINAVVLEAVEFLRMELRSEHVFVVTDLAPDLPMISGNRGQLQQLVLNLLANAVEAMRPIIDRVRVLKVSSRLVGGHSLQIDVADSGTGIEPKNVDRLFDAFFTTKPHGTGMGLAISRSIVETHGGRLSAMPNEPHGTVFGFTLPVEDEAFRPRRLPMSSANTEPGPK
jgi:signal transduction histidine kinase